MNRIAAFISIGAVIAFTVVHGLIILIRQTSGSSPLYFFPVGASACSIVAVAAGIVALAGGGSHLSSRDRQFAIIGIVAGLSYFGYVAMVLFRT
ncbi:MAG TPA: hypothetical protein VLE43_10110 [Candidatus Saccharimonadia bacterium]|nr:hypothetical protein [Candidatus Saccharimonadia bacterium]